MQVPGMVMVENAVDYLTATAYEHKLTEGQSAERFFQHGMEALEEEIACGNDKLAFSMQGFYGWRAGQATVATVGQAVMVRLSGKCAERHFKRLYKDATNVSRIDVQGTFRMDSVWRDMSFVHLDEVRAYAKQFRPRLKVHRVDGGKDGCSLMIGKRISDAWGRIYDKHAESGQKEYQDCWRYEVEFKRRYARRVAADLGGSERSTCSPYDCAASWLASVGVSLPKSGSNPTKFLGVTPTSSDARRLEWLAKNVAPTVKMLCSRELRQEVVSALFGWESSENS